MNFSQQYIKEVRDSYLDYISQPSFDIWQAAHLLEDYFEAIGRPEDFSLAFVRRP